MQEQHQHERRAGFVTGLTAVTMVVEIFFGLTSNSMALLADGIHMGSHVLAIGLSWLAYIAVRRLDNKENFKGDSKKILSLSGYSSGLLLLIFAFVIMGEAIKRIYHPMEIHFKEAILIAFIGLGVNIVSAILLHHRHEHSDINIRGCLPACAGRRFNQCDGHHWTNRRHDLEYCMARRSGSHSGFVYHHPLVGRPVKRFGKSIVGH